MAGTVVVVGSINADLGVEVDRFPQPGETLNGRGGVLAPGGKGANQALAARLQGAQVSMIGAVGDDAAADAALRFLREAGVHLERLHVESGATGIALVMVDAAGENQIIVIPGANASLSPDRVEQWLDQTGDEVVVMQGEIPVETIDHVAARTKGRLVLNLAPVVGVRRETILRADPLVVNEHEARLALRLLDPGHPAIDEEQELVSELMGQGCPSVVMTLGSRGALVGDASGILEVASIRVEAVDSTGAGDAFVGTLAADLALGKNLQAACRHAAAAAASTVEHRGAQSSYWAMVDSPDQPERQ